MNPPGIADVVLGCVCDDFEIPDREGRTGLGGFTNLKRILGRPADFTFVVDQLARTISAGHAVAACDEGAWARLAGERLPPGTPIHLIDDLVFAGHTLLAAREALNLVGLDGRTASAILWTYRADLATDELAAAGITDITSLVHQSQIPD